MPRALRAEVRGKRMAIVNDVINAGSAVRGTCADLQACGAEPVAIGALAVLGPSASAFAMDKKLALETMVSLPNEIWTPSACPLCVRGVPLEMLSGCKLQSLLAHKPLKLTCTSRPQLNGRTLGCWQGIRTKRSEGVLDRRTPSLPGHRRARPP